MDSLLRRSWLLISSWGVLGTGLLAACRRVASPRSKDEVAKAGALRQVEHIYRPGPEHWVGDGFWVRTVFSPSQVDAEKLSPFLLLDHGAPRAFDPARVPRGVGEHPHRGFETVTFAYQGEVDHRDSSGGGGRIYPGDVQWMTAARGVVHEEKHSQGFTERGGVLEMVQLWVNLPAKLKMTHPRYQGLVDKSFPRKNIGGATARVIAGELGEDVGPAKTNSPLTLFDVTFERAGEAAFSTNPGHTLLVVSLRGDVELPGEATLHERHVAVFDRNTASSEVLIRAKGPAKVLVLAGEPLGEPVVARGPFVMNSNEEIHEAIRDYQSGKMGKLRPTDAT